MPGAGCLIHESDTACKSDIWTRPYSENSWGIVHLEAFRISVQGNMVFDKNIWKPPVREAAKTHTVTLEGGDSPMTDDPACYRSSPAGDFRPQQARVSPPTNTHTGQGDAEGAQG